MGALGLELSIKMNALSFGSKAENSEIWISDLPNWASTWMACLEFLINYRYMPVRCHEVREQVERHLDYKYNYCLSLNTKLRVI